MFDKIYFFLLSIYYFYRNSNVNRALLKDSFKILNQSVVLPTRVGGTRWMSQLKRALESFLKGYDAISQHFNQVFMHLYFDKIVEILPLLLQNGSCEYLCIIFCEFCFSKGTKVSSSTTTAIMLKLSTKNRSNCETYSQFRNNTSTKSDTKQTNKIELFELDNHDNEVR